VRDFAEHLAAARDSSLAAISKPPTTEVGAMGDTAGVWVDGRPNWSYFMGDEQEYVPELQWKPGGMGMVAAYHMMRSDAQVQGLYMGSTLPIRRYLWHIEPNGAREEVVTKLSQDYGIPIKGQEDQPRGRSKRRFSFQHHLRHALLAILYGHMFFEQVGDIGDDGLWHLRKLGPRMPKSIMEISVADDGGLQAIKQNIQKRTAQSMFEPYRTIPVEKLVAYIWEQEGGNWIGRSMLRGIYKNWLLKDTVLRVGAINIERAGGVPVITGPKGATPEDLAVLARMARQFRVGEGSGGAIPNGAELNLARAAGGEEAVNYIKLQNEEMGRGWLMMFMNLGQATTGSYALGSSLIDYVMNSQETIANWYVDIFNEHIIEDDVDWNWGEDEPAPLLGYTRRDDRQLAVADLVQLIDKGVIQVDDELESWIRDEYQMPRRAESSTPRTLPAQAKRRKRVARSDSPAASPARPQEVVDA
jgi:hypothetical protein